MSNALVKHQFVSALADGSDATQVQPSQWNATHVFTTPDGIGSGSGGKGFLIGTDDGAGNLTLNGIKATGGLQYLRRNSANSDYEFVSISLNPITSTDYKFTSQACPDTLSPILRQITLNPVPLGVNGNDVRHKLGIFDNSGNFLEAFTISGGNAVSGSNASGQYVIANVLTGTYTPGTYKIGTVTAGIQEALNISSNVFVPIGTQQIYATLTPPPNSNLTGCTAGYISTVGTILKYFPDTGACINLINNNLNLENLSFVQAAIPTGVTYGIFQAGSGSGDSSLHGDWCTVYNCNINGFYYGFYGQGSGGAFNIDTMFIQNCRSTGYVGLGVQGWNKNIIIQLCGLKATAGATPIDGGHGYYISACAGSPTTFCGTSPWFSGISSFFNWGYGFYCNGGGITVSGNRSYFNNDRQGEVYGFCSGNLANFTIENAGDTGGTWPTNTTAAGLTIVNGSNLLTVTEGIIDGCQGHALNISATGIQFSDLQILNSGGGNIDKYGINSAGGTQNIYTNVTLSFCPAIFTGGARNIIRSSQFYGGTASIPSIMFTGNSIANIVDGNQLVNGLAGTCLQVDAGSTILQGVNHLAGAIVFNGAGATQGFANTFTQDNFVTEIGGSANNDIIAAFSLNPVLVNQVPLPGTIIYLLLNAHTLQAGANFLTLPGTGRCAIKSGRTTSADIAVGYGVGGIVGLMWNGTSFLNLSQ